MPAGKSGSKSATGETMRKLIVALLVVGLSGCAQVAGVLPSMQHCDKVRYERQDARVTINAECRAPIGGL